MQTQQTMQQTKPASDPSAEHHMQAAECCTKAAAEYTSAAKSGAAHDKNKTSEHAKMAQEQCTKALDHGKKAMAA